MSESVVRKIDITKEIVEVLREAVEKWGKVPMMVDAEVDAERMEIVITATPEELEAE
jgi:hypothetical protein